MLELLTEIAPTLKRVAMIFNSDMAPGHGTYYFRDFEAAARSSKLEPIAADARSDAKIETVVTSLRGEPRGGIVVTPDYFMLNHSQQIISSCGRQRQAGLDVAGHLRTRLRGHCAVLPVDVFGLGDRHRCASLNLLPGRKRPSEALRRHGAGRGVASG